MWSRYPAGQPPRGLPGGCVLSDAEPTGAFLSDGGAGCKAVCALSSGAVLSLRCRVCPALPGQVIPKTAAPTPLGSLGPGSRPSACPLGTRLICVISHFSPRLVTCCWETATQKLWSETQAPAYGRAGGLDTPEQRVAGLADGSLCGCVQRVGSLVARLC